MEPVIDSFLFSEAYEADVLLAKLHVEQDLVTHWVAVENAYTTKGTWKGVSLNPLLDKDRRFARFRNRFTVISLERRFADEYRLSLRDRLGWMARRAMRSAAALRAYRERPFFFHERRQREAATEAVLDLSNGKGWVIVSDVDEMVDGSTSIRRDLIERATSNAGIVHLPRRRFVYDFDNVSMAPFRYVPMARIDSLGAHRLSLGDFRLTPVGVPASLEPLVFEYSYCYDREEIARKLATFTHVDPGAEALTRALECNHAPVADGPILNHHWYETIRSDEAQHPAYIDENLNTLKTNVVPPDYHRARMLAYPELFGPASPPNS